MKDTNSHAALRHHKQVHSNQDSRVDQNPFKKVPKLHLFKKSRRQLKTSSANREGPEEEGEEVDGEDEHGDEQQTITSGH